MTLSLPFNPGTFQGVLRIVNMRESIINLYLEEYFGIDIQMKVSNFELQIPFVRILKIIYVSSIH